MERPGVILALSMMSSLFATATAQESTATVPVISPTSAVSPPPLTTLIPRSRSCCRKLSVPSISAANASPGKFRALRFTVLEITTLSQIPTQARSSRFITMLSCAIPWKTFGSPLSL